MAVARRLFALEQAVSLRVRGLNQVTLAVSDLERSLEFYQGLFGMPVQARRTGAVVLRIGDGPVFLALTEAGSSPPSIHHFGMAVEDFDDSVEKHMQHCAETLRSGMDAVRSHADTLETLVADAHWPLPKYREMLFIR